MPPKGRDFIDFDAVLLEGEFGSSSFGVFGTANPSSWFDTPSTLDDEERIYP
jgi:hypothetical protein